MKVKKTPEQLAAERQQKINNTLNSFQIQLVKLGKQKSYLLGKMSEARRNGLKAQEQQARGLLRNCLAHEKRVLGMQMQLDLAVQSRDLSNLQQAFLECVGTMADEIDGNVTKSTVKKSKKKYVKSLFNLGKQNERMDDFLQEGDYAMAISSGTNDSTEFDEEIDGMLENLDAGASRYGNRY